MLSYIRIVYGKLRYKCFIMLERARTFMFSVKSMLNVSPKAI